MPMNSFKYIFHILFFCVLLCGCSSLDSADIKINAEKSDIPISSSKSEAKSTNPPINMATTTYKRPNVLKIAETLNSLSSMISVVEGEEQALEYAEEFLRLYTQTLAMRDIIVAKYITQTTNYDYNMEVNFWLNYQKELDISINKFAKAINSTKHIKFLKEKLDKNIFSALEIEKNTSEKGAVAMENHQFLWETTSIFNGTNILRDSYNTFLTGEINGEGIISNKEKFLTDFTIAVEKRNKGSTLSGYKNYFEYILSHRNYTKSELWTMAKNIRESFSKITEIAINNYDNNAYKTFTSKQNLYNTFSKEAKQVSDIYNIMIKEIEEKEFINIEAVSGNPYLTGAKYINGSTLPYIYVGIKSEKEPFALLSKNYGEAYYFYNTKSAPRQNNGWVISACGKGNIFAFGSFYNKINPKNPLAMKNNDIYTELRLTTLNTLIYELEEYIYSASNLTENGILQKYNQLYKIYFPQCNSKEIKNAGLNIALYQMAVAPLSSCDNAISGVISLNIADISYKDENVALKLLNSLLVADTDISLKFALEKLSIPSPFSGVSVATSSFFIDNLVKEETTADEAVDISPEKSDKDLNSKENEETGKEGNTEDNS